MPRRIELLLVACLAGALIMPLAMNSEAQAQPGGLDRGFGTDGMDFPPLAGHRGYAARVDGSGWS
jgi:hypothetical protein